MGHPVFPCWPYILESGSPGAATGTPHTALGEVLLARVCVKSREWIATLIFFPPSAPPAPTSLGTKALTLGLIK